MPHVLLLSLYPREPAFHGAQIRLSNIAQAYSLAGFDVNLIGILSGKYKNSNHSDRFILPPPISNVLPDSEGAWLSDYFISSICHEDYLYCKLHALINFIPDIIQVEQPWLWPFVKRLKQEKNLSSCPVIYSSHNIESSLKYDILFGKLRESRVKKIIDEIVRIEREISYSANLVIAVTEQDAEILSRWTKSRIVVAKNGVSDWTVNINYLRRAKELCGDKKFPVFIGSAHPPNFEGFMTMLGPILGYIRPTQRLIVVGAAGPIMRQSKCYIDYKLFNDTRFLALGVVNHQLLNAICHLAHCFVLPILYGGGANLKTAEAIWAGKHIVGTPAAFRGFEEFMNATGVVVADEPKRFKTAVYQCLDTPLPAISCIERYSRRQVLWEETLKPMVKAVKDLL